MPNTTELFAPRFVVENLQNRIATTSGNEGLFSFACTYRSTQRTATAASLRVRMNDLQSATTMQDRPLAIGIGTLAGGVATTTTQDNMDGRALDLTVDVGAGSAVVVALCDLRRDDADGELVGMPVSFRISRSDQEDEPPIDPDDDDRPAPEKPPLPVPTDCNCQSTSTAKNPQSFRQALGLLGTMVMMMGLMGKVRGSRARKRLYRRHDDIHDKNKKGDTRNDAEPSDEHEPR
jgi:hypothetical protein